MATQTRVLTADVLTNLTSALSLTAGDSYELYNAGTVPLTLISRATTPPTGARGRPLQQDVFVIIETNAAENIYVRSEYGPGLIVVNDA